MTIVVYCRELFGKLWLKIIFPLSHFLFCRIVVVTGASTGIGRHVAESLANRGYVVMAGVRKQADAQSITDLNIDTLVPIFLDITDEDACRRVMKKVAEMTAKTNLPFVALVNNAGM